MQGYPGCLSSNASWSHLPATFRACHVTRFNPRMKPAPMTGQGIFAMTKTHEHGGRHRLTFGSNVVCCLRFVIHALRRRNEWTEGHSHRGWGVDWGSQVLLSIVVGFVRFMFAKSNQSLKVLIWFCFNRSFVLHDFTSGLSSGRFTNARRWSQSSH